MRALSVLIFGLMPTASAWEHLGRVWPEGDLPVAIVVYGEEDSVPAGASGEAIAGAAAAWAGPDCSIFEIALSAEAGAGGGFTNDGQNTVSFDDPWDDLPTGVYAASLSYESSEIVMTQGGVSYNRITDSDIVFNDDVAFVTADAIERGDCDEQVSIEAIALHELGHLAGLGHSCEVDEGCDDALEAAAMYWSTEHCDNSHADLEDDDVAGLYVHA